MCDKKETDAILRQGDTMGPPPAWLEATRRAEAAANAAEDEIREQLKERVAARDAAIPFAGERLDAEQPVTIELRLSGARWKKLSAFAEAERVTIRRALERFIDACKVGGGGWEAPEVKAKRREREERRGG